MNNAPLVNLATFDIDRVTGKLLCEKLARKIEGVCIGQPEPGVLTLVVSDPTEVNHYDLIDIGTGHTFRAQLLQGESALIRLAQEFIYHIQELRENETWKQWLETKKLEAETLQVSHSQLAGEVDVAGVIVERAERIIKEAISIGASDIHLETDEDGMTVRYRQDGLLRIIDRVADRETGQALIKRIKVLAGVDITQDHITQGGRIGLEIGGRGYFLRVSILPVSDGENIVLRILNKGAFNTTLEDLGMSEQHLQLFRRLIAQPHGMILTCGPTGSGKSTTLYASLKTIQRPDRKLLTIEDPIEYEMPGITQVQVNLNAAQAERHLTFASALREFLRHDPDVILVGEIRDEETAHVSVQAALTGHLVLSTLHTNDAVGIINRLKDQGVKPYLIAGTLIGGMAQRLVRRVCPNCTAPAQPNAEQLRLLEKFGLDPSGLRQGPGCEVCLGSGVKGRIGLYEIFAVNDPIRQLIEKGATSLEIEELARSQGMTSLLEDGLAKAARGVVPITEVERVAQRI